MNLHTRICKGNTCNAGVLNEFITLLLVLSSAKSANSEKIHPLI